MLDLGVPSRTLDGLELGSDTDDPTTFWLLPAAPKLKVLDGQPQLELLRFIKDGALQGGHLRLTTLLPTADAAVASAIDALSAELGRGRVAKILALPFVAAAADIEFAGPRRNEDGTAGSLTRTAYGSSTAGLDAPHEAAFAIPLDASGVALAEAALASGGGPFGVTYRPIIEGSWPAARVVAHVDWTRVYDHFSTNYRAGQLLTTEDISHIAETLVSSQAIKVEAVQGLAEDQSAPSLAPALAWIQQELVQQFCEPVLALDRAPATASLGSLDEVLGLGSAFAVKERHQVEQATADVDFLRRSVVQRTLSVGATLADLLAGLPREGLVSDAGENHPFFQRFELHVVSSLPLAQRHLTEIALDVAYGTTSNVIRLTPEARDGTFGAWANASADGSWTMLPSVTFGPDSPVAPSEHVTLPPLTGSSRELVLDVDGILGFAHVDLTWAPEDRVTLVNADLQHRRADNLVATVSFLLSHDAPLATAWFRDHQPGDVLLLGLRYLIDGRFLDGPRMQVDSTVVVVPPAFAGSMTVELLGDDDWSALNTVTVAIAKDASGPTRVFTFDRPGQLVTVALDLPDPLDRSYRYRMTRIFSDGHEESDDWATTDAPVIGVGTSSPNELSVELRPVGPELPTAGIRLIEVELLYVDPDHQVRHTATKEIAARADSPRWQVPIVDPSRRSYQYRVTTHAVSGLDATSKWATTDAHILAIPVVAPQGGA